MGEWQESIRKWKSISGDHFNVSMKKALFLDKAPSTVRVPLQMQNLDTCEAMTAVTLEFLQHNAQSQAGVTVTPNNRRGPDDMEIDASTKKGKGYKGNGKNNTDPTTDELPRVRTCWSHGQRLLGSRKLTRAVYPTTRARNAKAKARTVSTKSRLQRSRRRLHQWEPQPVKSRESSRRTLDQDEDYESGYILAAIRQRETFIQSKDWHVVHALVGF